MKTLCNAIQLLLLGIGMAAVLAIPGFAQGKDGGVTIQDKGIVIRPGTKLSKSDEKALNDVLGKYDMKLYRSETYKNGKLTKAVGDLKLDKEMASQVANAKAAGRTDSAVVFVVGPGTRMVPPTARSEDKNAKALIEQLKPILQKYNKP
jgi:hypothetical protein